MFTDDKMDAGNSRTVLRIVEELAVTLGAYRMDLVNVILDTLFTQICGSFERAWEVRSPFLSNTPLHPLY